MNHAIVRALASAALFGASTPLAKALLGEVAPLMLAALLYLGSGVGLAAWIATHAARGGARTAPFERRDWPWLAAARRYSARPYLKANRKVTVFFAAVVNTATALVPLPSFAPLASSRFSPAG